VHQAPKKRKTEKDFKRKKERNRKQEKKMFVVSIHSGQNIIFFCPLPLI